jgi:hypothetical protein
VDGQAYFFPNFFARGRLGHLLSHRHVHKNQEPAPAAHAYNSSYSGGRDQEDAPIILVIQEAEIRKIAVASPGK